MRAQFLMLHSGPSFRATHNQPGGAVEDSVVPFTRHNVTFSQVAAGVAIGASSCRKDAGVWKFRRFDYNRLRQADDQEGRGRSEARLPSLTETWPEDPRGPDRLVPTTHMSWPDSRIAPLPPSSPVTGKPWRDDE